MRIEPQPPARLRDAQRLQRPSETLAAPTSAYAGADAQSIELSEFNELLARLREITEDRSALLARIEQRLADGYYDQAQTFQEAAEHLAQDLDWMTGLTVEDMFP
ncbi:MAG: hypothetical protein RMJ19_05095 [Gemmatales bacterium]|nr:hypothetical protein [Gemmatales bacterium]MDW8175028.1 hypothetical protein [Gemmatales bacterium]